MDRDYYTTLTAIIILTSIPILITMSLFSSSKDTSSMNNYSGICISGNCENGKGVYEFKDGSKYIGNFEDSEFVSNQGDLWLFISDEFKEGEESFYLKAFSGEVEGDYIYIEDMSDFRDVYHPFNAKSVINYVEINCFESSSRPLNAKMYSSSLSQGFVTSTLSEADLIFDFVDFTESERGAVYHELCEMLQVYKGDPTEEIIFFKNARQNNAEVLKLLNSADDQDV